MLAHERTRKQEKEAGKKVAIRGCPPASGTTVESALKYTSSSCRMRRQRVVGLGNEIPLLDVVGGTMGTKHQ